MKQIVVISGKGGTGKTSIVSALAGLGPEKVLADCDVDAADLHLILHPSVVEAEPFFSGNTPNLDTDKCTGCMQCMDACKFNAIKFNGETCSVLKEQCEGCAACAFVCPEDAITMKPRNCGTEYISNTRYGTMVHAALGIGEENSGKLVTSVRQKAKQQAEEQGLGFVLVDGSPGVGCPVIASLTDTDMALLVAEPTVSAVHDLKRVYELTQHFKVSAALVINKCGLNDSLEKELRGFCEMNAIPVVGSLPYTNTFTQAQIAGQTICEFDPDGLGAKMNKMWDSISSILEM
ncbi:MAG: ATP-binding protein [Desulfovibrio sp.]